MDQLHPSGDFFPHFAPTPPQADMLTPLPVLHLSWVPPPGSGAARRDTFSHDGLPGRRPLSLLSACDSSVDLHKVVACLVLIKCN